MTFAAREESRSLGEPNEIYRFTVGNQVYGYTDAEQIITVDGVDYAPIPIDRDAVSSSGTMDKSALTVRVPRDTGVAELFAIFPPSEIVGLTIFQGHADEDEYLAIWAGRVLSGKQEDSEVALTCEPITTSMKRPGLRVRDQYQCMHALYGPACKANRTAFTVQATVIGVAGSVVTLATGWQGSFPPLKFTNGIIQWGNEQRQILRVNPAAGTMQVGGSTASLRVGTQVALSLGCNHSMSDCLGVFGNILNFGGCPYIPKKNPIGQANQFY